jgi:hypothetical protein
MLQRLDERILNNADVPAKTYKILYPVDVTDHGGMNLKSIDSNKQIARKELSFQNAHCIAVTTLFDVQLGWGVILDSQRLQPRRNRLKSMEIMCDQVP